MEDNLPIPITYAKNKLLGKISDPNTKDKVIKIFSVIPLSIDRKLDLLLTGFHQDLNSNKVSQRFFISTNDFISIGKELNIDENIINYVIDENESKNLIHLQKDISELSYDLKIRSFEDLKSLQKQLPRSKKKKSNKSKLPKLTPEERLKNDLMQEPSNSLVNQINKVLESGKILFFDSEFQSKKGGGFKVNEIGLISIDLNSGKIETHNFIFNSNNFAFNTYNMDLLALKENDAKKMPDDLIQIQSILESHDHIVCFSPESDIKLLHNLGVGQKDNKFVNIQYTQVSLQNLISKYISDTDLFFKKTKQENNLIQSMKNTILELDKSKNKKKVSPFIGDIGLHSAFNDALVTFCLFSKIAESKLNDTRCTKMFDQLFLTLQTNFKSKLKSTLSQLEERKPKKKLTIK